MEKKTGKTLKVTWFGHACFRIESDGYTIVIDPYEDRYVPGLGALRTSANEVLISHGHRDHNYAAAVSLTDGPVSPFAVESFETFHDDRQGEVRGTSLVHILDNGGMRLAHLGDLGCRLTEDQKSELQNLNVLMIPVGGYYTIGPDEAQQLVQELKPQVVIPMHYRGDSFGYDVLETVDAFADRFDTVVEYPGNTLEVDDETITHVAVLQLDRGDDYQGE